MEKSLALATSIGEIEIMARAANESGFYQVSEYQNGKNKNRPISIPEALMKIKLGLEYGFGEAQSLSLVQVIQGKPTVSAKGLAAMVKASNKYDYRIIRSDDLVCELQFYQRSGSNMVEAGPPIIYSMKTADKAGHLTGPNAHTWRKYPSNMLFARAISDGVGRFCPDIAAGLYSQEEMMDVEDEPAQLAPPTPTAKNEPAQLAPTQKPAIIQLPSAQEKQEAIIHNAVNATKTKEPKPKPSKPESTKRKDKNPFERNADWLRYVDLLGAELEYAGMELEDLMVSGGPLFGMDDIKFVQPEALKKCLDDVIAWNESDETNGAPASEKEMREKFDTAKNVGELGELWQRWLPIIRTFSPLFLIRAIKYKDDLKDALKKFEEKKVDPPELEEEESTEEEIEKKEKPEEKREKAIAKKGKWEKANAALHAKAAELGYGEGDVIAHERIKEIFSIEGSLADVEIKELTRMRKALEADGEVVDEIDNLETIKKIIKKRGENITEEDLENLFVGTLHWPKHVKFLADKLKARTLSEIQGGD